MHVLGVAEEGDVNPAPGVSILPAQSPEKTQGAPGRSPTRVPGTLPGSWFPYLGAAGWGQRCQGPVMEPSGVERTVTC